MASGLAAARINQGCIPNSLHLKPRTLPPFWGLCAEQTTMRHGSDPCLSPLFSGPAPSFTLCRSMYSFRSLSRSCCRQRWSWPSPPRRSGAAASGAVLGRAPSSRTDPGAHTQTCFPEVQLQLESGQRLREGSRFCAPAFAHLFSARGLLKFGHLARQVPDTLEASAGCFRRHSELTLTHAYKLFCTLPPELTHASSFWHPRSAHPCCKRTQRRMKHSAEPSAGEQRSSCKGTSAWQQVSTCCNPTLLCESDFHWTALFNFI